jgi:hypothetical protein
MTKYKIEYTVENIKTFAPLIIEVEAKNFEDAKVEALLQTQILWPFKKITLSEKYFIKNISDENEFKRNNDDY